MLVLTQKHGNPHLSIGNLRHSSCLDLAHTADTVRTARTEEHIDNACRRDCHYQDTPDAVEVVQLERVFARGKCRSARPVSTPFNGKARVQVSHLSPQYSWRNDGSDTRCHQEAQRTAVSYLFLLGQDGARVHGPDEKDGIPETGNTGVRKDHRLRDLLQGSANLGVDPSIFRGGRVSKIVSHRYHSVAAREQSLIGCFFN